MNPNNSNFWDSPATSQGGSFWDTPKKSVANEIAKSGMNERPSRAAVFQQQADIAQEEARQAG